MNEKVNIKLICWLEPLASMTELETVHVKASWPLHALLFSVSPHFFMFNHLDSWPRFMFNFMIYVTISNLINMLKF